MSTDVGEGFRGPEGRLGYLLRQAHQAMRTAIEQEMREIEITAPQFSLLSVIRHEPGLTGSELAQDSMLTQQTTSEIVLGLERRGLIERRHDPRDRRTRRIHLTDDGARVLGDADARVARLEEKSVRSLPDDDDRRRVAAWLVDCARLFGDRHSNGPRRVDSDQAR